MDILITVRVNELESEHCIATGKTVDISANGVLLTYDSEIPVDTTVQLTFFPLDTDTLIDVRGKVRRVEKVADQYNLAIEFNDLKPDMVQQLDIMLNTEAKD